MDLVGVVFFLLYLKRVAAVEAPLIIPEKH